MTRDDMDEYLLRSAARSAGGHVAAWAVREIDRLRAELDHRAEEANAVVDAVTTVEVRG